ncbi:MAG: peroxiredoxin [Rhodospirillaceae bacterium]
MAAKAKAKKSPAKKPAKKAAPKTAKKAAAKPASSLVGKAAPAFKMPMDDGSTLSLKDLRGKTVVLYFYPKDDTTGCTAEACDFRDRRPDFTALDATVIGVSKDPVKSHQKFKTKYSLNFALASDDSGACEAYGVWKEKSMYGRKYMGVERSTFIIDKSGIVRAEWRKVSVPGHAEEVKQALRGL